MQEPTRKNLQNAFAVQSQAYVRYLRFAEAAEKEGRRNVARLFRAAAFSEQVHAAEHLAHLGEVKSTSENLAAAIETEGYEINEMYPDYIKTAEEQNEEGAKTSLARALEAEKIHYRLYAQAKQVLDAGEDADISEISLCSECGETVEGEPPGRCPLCNSPKDMFVKY